MVDSKIVDLKRAVEKLASLTGDGFEAQFEVVREAAQALKTAIATEFQQKNYQGLLIRLDRLLAQYRWSPGKVTQVDIVHFLDSLNSKLDKIQPIKLNAPKQQWSTKDRLTEFGNISQATAQQSLDGVLNHWSLNSGGTVAKHLQDEGIGKITAIRIKNNDFELAIKDPQYKGLTSYHRTFDAATGKATVTMRLPPDHISSATRMGYQKQAKITVLAELALLRTVHAEKTDAAFAELIKASPREFNPTDPKNRYDRAYCEALRAAYIEFGFEVSNPSHASTVAPTTVNPPKEEEKDESTPGSSHVFSATVESSVRHDHSFSATVQPGSRVDTFSASVGGAYHTMVPSMPLDHTFSATVVSHQKI